MVNCKYCNKDITIKHLNRHYRINCKEISDKAKQYYINRYNSNNNHKKAMDAKNMQNKNTDSLNNIATESYNTATDSHNNNNTNSHNTTTTNNTTNNITNNINVKYVLELNPLGTADMSIFSIDDITEILNEQKRTMELVMEKITSHPSNFNAYISNTRERRVTHLSNDGKIKIKKIDEALDDLVSYCTIAYSNMVDMSKQFLAYEDEYNTRDYETNKIRKDSLLKGEYSDKLEKLGMKALENNKELHKKILNIYTSQQNDNDKIKENEQLAFEKEKYYRENIQKYIDVSNARIKNIIKNNKKSKKDKRMIFEKEMSLYNHFIVDDYIKMMKFKNIHINTRSLIDELPDFSDVNIKIKKEKELLNKLLDEECKS